MKTNNYKGYVMLGITKHNNGFYTLRYVKPTDEAWALYGTKEEILEELSEHMELMKGEEQ